MAEGKTQPELASLFGDINVVERLHQQERDSGKTESWTNQEVLFLIVAGHETTATGTGWMAYAVAREPEVQERLYDEVRDLALTDIDADRLWEKLEYHKLVVKECLRLYPPLPIYARSLDQDVVINNVRVPKGVQVNVINFVIHRHPDYWDNPDEFDPERFTDSRSKGRERGTYLPFSMGPRSCTGENMGFAQMVLILAHLVKNFRFSIANKNPIIPRPSVSLRSSEPISLRLEPR